MTIRIVSAATFTLLVLATVGGVAFAATKVTPALGKNSTDSFQCRVLNTSSNILEAVTVSIVGGDGSVLVSSVRQNIPAGGASALLHTGTATVGSCRVEGSFSKSKLQVTFCVLLSGSLRCEVAVGDPGLK